MACERRQHSGFCYHNQCPHPEDSGYECVDIKHSLCELAGFCGVTYCKYNGIESAIVYVYEAGPDTDFEDDLIGWYRTYEDALNHHDPFVHVNGEVHKPFYMHISARIAL